MRIKIFHWGAIAAILAKKDNVNMKFQRKFRIIKKVFSRGLSPGSVAGSIILPIVIVTIISGAIATVVSTDFMSKSAAQNAEIRLDAVATQAAEQIGGLLARSLSDAAVLSQDPMIRSTATTPEEKLAEMQRIQMFYGTFEDITLVDLDGKVITSTSYKYQGEWKTNRLFQSAAQGTPSMADATLLLDPHTVVIQIAFPVVDTHSNIISVLAAQINMDYIWQVIGRVKVGRTGYVCLIDKSGNIIAGPQKERPFDKIAFALESSSMPPEHQLIRYNDGNADMCAVVAGIDPRVPWAGNKWSFVGILPAAEAFAPVHDMELLFLTTILILLFVFVVVGLILGRLLSDKIRTLARGTVEIEKGNLHYRLPALKPKELGQLADSFNRMAIRLDISAAEISRWNASLEKQVQAKAKELDEIMAVRVQSERLSAMGYLATSLAHELNNFLNSIMSYAKRGQEELDHSQNDGDASKALENSSDYFRAIERELQRCKDVVRKLLSFVQYSKTKNEPVDINKVIGDTISIADHHLKINTVELSTQLQPDLPPVMGDAHQLEQVFLNIVLNAQKAMPKGGKLTITTRLNNEKEKHMVEVLFADTGYGIPPENMDKIFEPFSSTAPKGEGAGLGLAVGKNIVEQHGGEIKVKSGVGVGTTFTVSLPPANSSLQGDKSRILGRTRENSPTKLER